MTHPAYPGMPESDMPAELLKTVRRGHLGAAYSDAIASGFGHGGSTVQIDLVALPRMVAVLAEIRAGKANAHGGFWVLGDNTKVSLDDAQATELLEGSIARRLAIDQVFFTARDELSSAETIDEINAVEFDFGGI